MDHIEAAKKATGKLWTNLHSGLTAVLAVAVVIIVIIGYSVLSKVVEALVGGAAGAAAGLGVSHLMWKEEERSAHAATAVVAIAGGIAGTAAAVLRSLLAAYSITGSAVVGALAGAAIVALAKGLLQWLIVIVAWIIDYWNELKHLGILGIFTLAAGFLGKCAKWLLNKIKPLMDAINGIADKVKHAIRGITDIANRLFSPLGGLGAIGGPLAAVLGSMGLALSLGLLGPIGIITMLLGGSGILYVLHCLGQLQEKVKQLVELVNSVGASRFWLVLLLLLLLFVIRLL